MIRFMIRDPVRDPILDLIRDPTLALIRDPIRDLIHITVREPIHDPIRSDPIQILSSRMNIKPSLILTVSIRFHPPKPPRSRGTELKYLMTCKT